MSNQSRQTEAGTVVQLADYRKPALPAAGSLAAILRRLEPAPDWHTGWLEMEAAKHRYFAADLDRLLVGRKHPDSYEHAEAKAVSDALFDRYRQRQLALIFIAAPTVRALRWKQAFASKNHHHEEIEAAINRDMKALADRLSAVSRQQAGRRKV